MYDAQKYSLLTALTDGDFGGSTNFNFNVEIRKCGHVIYAGLHDGGHLVPWLSERT